MPEHDDASQFRWIEKGDRPFVPLKRASPQGPRPTTPFDCLHLDDGQYGLCEGYYQAGRLLAQRIADHAAPERPHPSLMMPTLYCFRHFLELSLKSLIRICSELAGKPVPTRRVNRCGLPAEAAENVRAQCAHIEHDESVIDNEHGIMPLWTICRRLIVETFPPYPEDTTTLSAIEACLNDFHQVDSSSQTFRYHLDRSGTPTEERIPPIDLARLLITMEKIHSFFDGCDLQAGHLMSLKDDFAAQYRDDQSPHA